MQCEGVAGVVNPVRQWFVALAGGDLAQPSFGGGAHAGDTHRLDRIPLTEEMSTDAVRASSRRHDLAEEVREQPTAAVGPLQPERLLDRVPRRRVAEQQADALQKACKNLREESASAEAEQDDLVAGFVVSCNEAVGVLQASGSTGAQALVALISYPGPHC